MKVNSASTMRRRGPDCQTPGHPERAQRVEGSALPHSLTPPFPHYLFVRSCGPCAHRCAMLSCVEASARSSPPTTHPVSLTSRTPLLLVATLVALPLLAQAQAPRAASPSPASRAVPPDAPLPFDTSVIRGALPNGIHYLVRRNVKPENRAELRLVVNAGSILENDRQLGVAHFVEHMAFNGTRRFPKAS